jgi:SNF2 family DNA or RNA helicase
MPHDPLDIWSQYRFLDPAIFGTSFHSFKKRYAELGFFNEPKKWINQDELRALFHLLTYTVDSSVLDLPPVTHQMLSINLGDDVMKHYKKFKKDLAAEINGGLITADNVLVRAIRLQQLTSGFFVDENTKTLVELSCRAKEEALNDWLDSIPRDAPKVVFTRFTHDLDTIQRAAIEAGLRYGEVSGRRNDLTVESTMRDDIELYGINIQSGGVGVDLSRSSYGLYYSIDWNRGNYDQSIARLLRPGQAGNCHFTHLVAADTVDPEIYEAFEEGRSLTDALTKAIRH